MPTPKKTTPVQEPDAAPAVPVPVPPGGWPRDEFTGLSGSFVRCPVTGVRSRAVEPAAL